MNNSQFTKILIDDSLMETAEHGSISYPFKYYYENIALFDFNRIDWHWHNELEFVYIETGNVLFDVGNNHFELSAGQGIMINSKILHQLYSKEDAVIPNFLFQPAFIAPTDSLIYTKYILPIVSSSVEYIIFDSRIPWQAEVIEAMKEIIALQNGVQSNELLVSMLIQKLWLIIFQNQSFDLREDRITMLNRTRLQLMMEYIHNHFKENISLEDIVGAANISKSTGLKLFQNNLKITPVNYLINYRLKLAAQMLIGTTKNVTAIALETGFNDVDYFCRSFKKGYHVTPSDYRKQKGSSLS